MPTKLTKQRRKSNIKSENGSKTQATHRSSDVRHQRGDPNQHVVLETVEAVHGLYRSMDGTEQALKALKCAGFRESDILVSPMISGIVTDSAAANAIHGDTYNQWNALGGTIARIAGVAFGIGYAALAIPIIVPLRLARPVHILENRVLVQINTDDPILADEAATVLVSSGGHHVGFVGQYGLVASDLMLREYRDEAGRIHHHTHTYMSDHADDQRSAAA